MGYAKHCLEMGFSTLPDKFVCKDCFEDDAIWDVIEGNATYNECSYCGKKSEDKPIAMCMDKLLELIVEAIQTEYDDPTNCVGWDSREGGWQCAEVFDTYTLLAEEIELEVSDEKLLNDIVSSIQTTEWCKEAPYGLPLEDELYYSWEEFSDQVKYHIRYVFFRTSEKTSEDWLLEDNRPSYNVLYHIGDFVNELNLVKPLPIESKFFRVRHDKDRFYSVEDIGPPPREKTISNRMNPYGIPMFYGALDRKTAMSETYKNQDELPLYYTIATFQTLKQIKVVDLTELHPIPSLFDQSERHLRPQIKFLESFLHDIKKPIERDGKEHIEYVPTQVVTEYFRHIFRDNEGEKIKGIIYQSPYNLGGRNCVLFFNNKNCIQDTVIVKKQDTEDKWLSMLSSSITHIKHSVI